MYRRAAIPAPGFLSPARTGAPATDRTWHVMLPDDGCRYSTSCLECPLPKCKHDMGPGEAKRIFQSMTDRRRMETISSEGLTVQQAAERFGICQRTVLRILERTKREMSSSQGEGT